MYTVVFSLELVTGLFCHTTASELVIRLFCHSLYLITRQFFSDKIFCLLAVSHMPRGHFSMIIRGYYNIQLKLHPCMLRANILHLSQENSMLHTYSCSIERSGF